MDPLRSSRYSVVNGRFAPGSGSFDCEVDGGSPQASAPTHPVLTLVSKLRPKQAAFAVARYLT
jgi:hypothetical protein